MMISLLQKLFPATTNQNTWASNPGNLRVDYWKYFRSFPAESRQHFADLFWWLFFFPTINLAYWFCGYWFVVEMPKNYSVVYPDLPVILTALYWIFGLGLNIAFLNGLFGVFRVLGFWLRHLQDHFSGGCVNPAVVVSQSPPLIAVATDLRKWNEPYPVIKILEQPLSAMSGGIPPVGTRLATVALYWAGAAHLPHWVDFNPIVVNCVTDNQVDIDRVFNTLQVQEWRDLQDGLRQIENHNQPGLY